MRTQTEMVAGIKITDRGRSMAGFSLVELLSVFAVILILTVISIPFIYQYRKAYRSEEQAMKVMDLMQEAGQLSLNRRRTIRLEIDLTDNAVKLIDENGAAADTLIKSIPLDSVADLRMDAAPTGITPPNPPNYNAAVYAADTLGHMDGSTNVINNTVWAARFRSDGSVVGPTNVPVSATIYIWPPRSPGNAAPRDNREVRSITMFGGSGAVRYWKHDGTSFRAY